MASVIESLLGPEVAGLLYGKQGKQEYPCQAEPMKDPPPRLMAFLYLLARDKLSTGEVEALMIAAERSDTTKCCNPHLESLARAYCTVLVGLEAEAMDGAEKALRGIREQLEEAGLWTSNGHKSLARLIADLQDHRKQAERMNAEIERLRGMVRDDQAWEAKLQRYDSALNGIRLARAVDADTLRAMASEALGIQVDA